MAVFIVRGLLDDSIVCIKYTIYALLTVAFTHPARLKSACDISLSLIRQYCSSFIRERAISFASVQYRCCCQYIFIIWHKPYKLLNIKVQNYDGWLLSKDILPHLKLNRWITHAYRSEIYKITGNLYVLILFFDNIKYCWLLYHFSFTMKSYMSSKYLLVKQQLLVASWHI